MMRDLRGFARELACAVAGSESLDDAAREQYGSGITVEIGFDKDRTDWASIAPFAVLVPDGISMEDGYMTHSFALLLGVLDEERESVCESVTQFRGESFLSGTFLPEVLHAMADSVRLGTLDVSNIDINQESAPLFYCTAALTVTVPVGIGDTRY